MKSLLPLLKSSFASSYTSLAQRKNGAWPLSASMIGSITIFMAIGFWLSLTEQKSIHTSMTQPKPLEGSSLSPSSSDKSPQLQNPLFHPSETSQWKRELYARLDRIRLICGELCNVHDATTWNTTMATAELPKNGQIPMLRVPNIDCDAIVGNADMDAGDTSIPGTIPPELLPFYQLGGLIDFKVERIFNNVHLGGNGLTPVWTAEFVEGQIATAMSPNPRVQGGYGTSAVIMVREKVRALNVTGKSALVVGSESPWVEAILLGLGADRVTTLEYGAIWTNHSKLRTYTPDTIREQYQKGTLEPFDVVVSHSSLEHSGLGRYGDALNPWGDVLAMARVWCLTKPGGGLYLGLPSGKDAILFNAHRIYGRVRWPLVTANWQQIDGDTHDNGELDEPARFDVPNGASGFLFQKVNA